jgi:putative flippase GtrA
LEAEAGTKAGNRGNSIVERLIMKNIVNKLLKIRLINFMLVGGICFVINMAFYLPLTLLFQEKTTIFGQEFYLPPFLISTAIAITCNYFLSRRITFGDSTERSLGIVKYMATYWATIPFEMVLLYLLVHFGKLHPSLAAALAILSIFISRYIVVKKIVWRTKKVFKNRFIEKC